MKADKNKLSLPESFVGVDVEEQETIITAMRGEDMIRIFTADNTMLTKLKKLAETGKDQYTVESIGRDENRNPVCVTVVAPKRCLSLRAGNKKELSEEEREALRERMRNIKK